MRLNQCRQQTVNASFRQNGHSHHDACWPVNISGREQLPYPERPLVPLHLRQKVSPPPPGPYTDGREEPEKVQSGSWVAKPLPSKGRKQAWSPPCPVSQALTGSLHPAEPPSTRAASFTPSTLHPCPSRSAAVLLSTTELGLPRLQARRRGILSALGCGVLVRKPSFPHTLTTQPLRRAGQLWVPRPPLSHTHQRWGALERKRPSQGRGELRAQATTLLREEESPGSLAERRGTQRGTQRGNKGSP
ncbi:uncharacterized protein [Oryctolagus cuniculus]|uniref:uncharacterized protein n=1 Tax=Oryctolagus cuniculus TaxID=9986 RepID=UPI00387A5D16